MRSNAWSIALFRTHPDLVAHLPAKRPVAVGVLLSPQEGSRPAKLGDRDEFSQLPSASFSMAG